MTAIDFSSFVDQLAGVSGDSLLPFFPTARAIDNKKTRGFDPVTAADRAAEQAMRVLIRKNFPGHGVIGEEYSAERTDAEYVWVLDPIDGTKSFITGMVAWGTLIGLMRFGEPVFGMMNQPFTREKFSGDGGAARYRGPGGNRDLHVRGCPSLHGAIMSTTSPLLMKHDDRATFVRLEDKVRLSRYGGDCYAYCMLAAGLIDLVVETEIKPHDIVPLIPVITGAGGIETSRRKAAAASWSRGMLACTRPRWRSCRSVSSAAFQERTHRRPPRTGHGSDSVPAGARAWRRRR